MLEIVCLYIAMLSVIVPPRLPVLDSLGFGMSQFEVDRCGRENENNQKKNQKKSHDVDGDIAFPNPDFSHRNTNNP